MADQRTGKAKQKGEQWEGKLIFAVSQKAVLYNKSLVDYKDRTKKEQAWESVAAMVGKSVAECMKRWKTLMDGYRQYLKTLAENTTSGSANKNVKVWKYATVMSFMKEHMAKRETSGNMGTSAATSQGPQHRSTFISQGTSSSMPSHKRAHPASTHATSTHPKAQGTRITLPPPGPDHLTAVTMECAAAGETSRSLPPPPATHPIGPTVSSFPAPDSEGIAQASGTWSDEEIPETQAQDNPEPERYQLSEDDEYIEEPRKVRRHQSHLESEDMTAFQMNLVRAMEETAGPSVPITELSGSHQFYLSIAKMADTLSARGQALVQKKLFEAYYGQLMEEMGEQAP